MPRSAHHRDQASGQLGAAATADATLAVLDDYTASLAKMAEDACVAARVRHQQSQRVHELRAACVARRQGGLRALAAELGRADAPLVQRAEEAARALPPPAECADVEALSDPLQVPADAARRAPVAAVRAVLAELQATRLSGGLVPVVRAEAALPLARATGFPPVVAEARLEVATARGAAERPAEEAFVEAAVAAMACGHDRVLANAAIAAGSAVGREGARAAEAERWLRLAEASLVRAGEGRATEIERGNLEAARATFALEDRRTAEAEDHARRATRLFLEHAPESRPLFAARAVLARALHARRKLDEAEIAVRENLAQALRTGLGPADLAQMHDILGLVEMDRERWDEATRANRRALELARIAFGPESRLEGKIENNFAIIQIQAGRRAEALPILERAIAIGEKTMVPASPKISGMLANQGRLLEQLGRPDEARPPLERARDIVIAEKGPDDFRLILILGNLAKVASAQRRHAEARSVAARALAIAERRAIHDGQWLMALHTQAMVHGDDPRASLPLHRRAVAALEEVRGRHPLGLLRPSRRGARGAGGP